MYLLTIRKSGAYFGLETKYMRRIVELNEGEFTTFVGKKIWLLEENPRNM
mgnify:CR=1 FL=1